MTRIDVDRTASRLKAVRKEHGFKVAHISSMLNVSAVAVYRWEQGKTLPSIDNLVALAEIYECALDVLIVVER